MLKKVLLPTILVLLAYGFWVSPDFKDVAAGIALFMFGMILLEEGFKAFTGGALETVLRKSTSHQWKSFSFGMVATSLMQSSSLVSLITISFVGAQMITLAAGIGIIMGANIGTTTGAWLIAGFGLKVDIASYAMPMLVFGVVLLFQKNKVYKGIGSILMGVAFLFLGIHYMKIGFEAFQSGFDLTAYAVPGLVGVLLFTLIGMAITTIMQSSHATLLITIAALATGQVTYENALALSIGANLGSTITALLGGVASNIWGKRLAFAHLTFNILTAAVTIIFINQFVWLVDHLASFLGIADDSYLLKLALFHTLFNLLGVILLWPFVNRLEAELIKRVDFKPESSQQPLYLYPQALETPATAVSAVRQEVAHLFDNAYGILAHGISLRRAVIESDESLEEAVKYTRRIMPLDLDDNYENKIKSLHNEIVDFIGQAQMRELTPEATEELYILRQASRDVVESVKAMKHLHKNLSKHGVSGNLAIREEYDAMRLILAKLLRALQQARRNSAEPIPLSMDAVKLDLEKSSRDLIFQLDDKIRHRRIQPALATSIMNDEGYTVELGRNLIDALQVILTEKNMQTTHELALSTDEIEQLANESSIKSMP